MIKKNKTKGIARDFAKSIIYRIYSSVITVLISFAITQKLMISLSIGVVDSIIKIFTYFIYERVWRKFEKSKDAKSKYNPNEEIFSIQERRNLIEYTSYMQKQLELKNADVVSFSEWLSYKEKGKRAYKQWAKGNPRVRLGK